MRYHREESNSDQVIQVLNVIGESGQKSLNSLKLLCLAREGEEEKAVITKEELDVVVKLAEAGGGISWVDIELGDGLLVTQDYEILTTLERLLEVGKDSLESVTIHGGLKVWHFFREKTIYISEKRSCSIVYVSGTPRPGQI